MDDHPMNVSFLKDEPLNSIIVDSSDERPLYEVHTPRKLVSRVTTVRRLQEGVASGTGEVLAEIQWHSMAPTITLFGEPTVRVKDWLKRKGVFTTSRILTTIDGSSYTWNYSYKEYTLKNTSTHTQIAKSHRSKKGWFGGTPRRMNIDISPEGMHFIDTIIVSFVIMEELARKRQRSGG